MTLGRFVIDITPLRISRDFRLLYIARMISMLSVGILSVAVNLQVFEMTRSSLHVGLVSFCVAAPMMAGLIAGGVLADQMDRRRLMLWTRTAYIAVALAFLANAAAASPSLWVIYATAVVAGVINGLSSPPMMASIPALVGREHIVSAGALTTISTQLGAMLGPSVAGVLAAKGGFAACYATVVAGAVITPALLFLLRPMPPAPGPPRASGVKALADGLRFILDNRMITGLLLIDVAATLFATPQALFPQMGTERFLGDASTIGLLYATPAAGALLGTIASGWTVRSQHAGMALVWTVVTWGLSITAFGLASNLGLALAILVVAGLCHTTSEILRRGLLQHHTPDHLQGRVSSLWLMQAIAGPSLGNVEAGFAARWLGPAAALTVGGVLCVVLTGAVAARFPELRKAGLRPSVAASGSGPAAG